MKRLTEWAYTDAVTGLANRRLFSDRLSHALCAPPVTTETPRCYISTWTGSRPSMTALGTRPGTVVLRSVAKLLRGAVRQTDTVARLGGDEFAILLEYLDAYSRVDVVARKILTAWMPDSLSKAQPSR